MGGLENKERPLVSVIVPVYRTERYLYECVESILRQSYCNLEIILVDDGSPDSCPVICDGYAQRDGRITVIHQRNKGLSAARNKGLDNMHGKYLAFVDSDDAIEKDFIMTAVDLLERRQLDGVMVEATLLNEESQVIGSRFHVVESYTETLAEKVLEMIITDRIGSQVYKCIYNSKCWEHVRFPIGRLYEDIATTFKAYINMKNPVAFIPQKLYRYRLNSQGISLSIGNDGKKVYHIFLGFREQYEYASRYCGQKAASLCMANAANAATSVMGTFASNTCEFRDAFRFFWSNRRLIIIDQNIKLKMRWKIVLKAIFPWLTKILRKLRKARYIGKNT